MIEFWRNLRKSAEERRQEQVNAYLDESLSARERAAFEQQLASDADLRAEVDALRLLKQNLSRLPRRRAPRNFTLDPAVYGKPARQPLFQLAPVLPVATVLTAVLFVFLIGLEAVGNIGFGAGAPAAEESVALFEIEAEPQLVEVTRVVTETETVTETVVEAEVAVEEAEEMAADDMADEAEMEEAMPEEEAMEEEAMEDEEMAEEEALPTLTPAPLGTAAAEGAPTGTEGGIDGATMATAPEEAAEDSGVVATALPTAEAYPAPAEAVVADGEAYDVPETAVREAEAYDIPAEEPAVPEQPVTQPPANPLRIWQIVAGLLVIILLGLTFYVRRLQ